jgi:SAM-dependent methyltransferase
VADAPNLAPDAFRGTAEAYARFRPPYPSTLLDALVARLPAHQRLLDLACGPGRIGLALAHRFGEAWLLDLEPEMIDVARRRAEREGLANTRFFTGRAEALDAPTASFDLITIGEAFHRLDQRTVAANAFRWLKPGGLIATMGGAGFFQGHQLWKKAILGIARRYFPPGWATAAPGASGDVADIEDILLAAGLVGVTTTDYATPHAWTIDSIIGYLHSTSVCSEQALGGQSAAFVAELTQALLAIEPSGRFAEELGFGCTSGRKPAA